MFPTYLEHFHRIYIYAKWESNETTSTRIFHARVEDKQNYRSNRRRKEEAKNGKKKPSQFRSRQRDLIADSSPETATILQSHTVSNKRFTKGFLIFFLKGIQLSPGHDTRSCSNRKNKTPPSLPGQVPSPSEGLAVVDEGGGRRGGGCGVKKAESPIMRRVLALKLVAEDRRSFVRSARNEACPSSMKRKSRAGWNKGC